jgi:hypothetical protein
MSLFKFEKNKVNLEKDIAFIKEFAYLLKQKNSDQLLAFVYHFCDWKSPYAVYPQEERQQKLLVDFLDNKTELLEKEYLQNAISKYQELSQTDSLLLLASARKAVQKLRMYFEQVNPADEEDPGKSATSLMNNLKNVGEIIKRLKDWEEIIKQEKDTLKIRKGIEIDEFNE